MNSRCNCSSCSDNRQSNCGCRQNSGLFNNASSPCGCANDNSSNNNCGCNNSSNNNCGCGNNVFHCAAGGIAKTIYRIVNGADNFFSGNCY